MSHKRGRPPGLTANRIAKRRIIAGAVLAGIKVAAVARQLGVSRSWASREANAPGTRLLTAQLLAPHRERLSRLFDQTLDVIEDAFQARKSFVVKGTPLRLSCFPNAGSRHTSLGHRGQHSRG